MGALGNGNFHFWLRFSSNSNRSRHFRKPKSSSSSSSKSINSNQGSNWGLSKFPLKQSLIASSLSVTGDTIAQLRDRYFKRQGIEGESKDNTLVLWSDHDWLRSLRMASYGFLFYGPGSYAWYKLLDNYMPNPTVVNLSTKVLLNQIILGPCVIAVIFAWNNLWLGKLQDLPSKFSVLDSCQHIEFWGGTAFFSCGVHVCGLHLLEFLSVHNYEQVILNLKLNLMEYLGKKMLNDSASFSSSLELQTLS